MFGYVLIAAGFAAYGPPASRDAYLAFTDRILVDMRAAGDVQREDDVKYHASFPSDVIIERCVRKQNRKVALENGAVGYFGGYECLMEIWPNAAPPYRTSGFFRHDGFDWRYHGPVRQTAAPSPSMLDSPNRGTGVMLTKPGSLVYDGDPDNPISRDYNPYRDHFEESGWDLFDPNY